MMNTLIRNNSYTLFWLAAIAGYAYILLLPYHPYSLSYLLKAAPVLTLGLLALFGTGQLGKKQTSIFVIAMLGSAAGDMFLDFDRTLYLKHALASFLVTQIAYVMLFWPKRDLATPRRVLIAPLSVLVLALVYLFSKTAGPLFVPVLVYVIVLCAMAFSALLVANNPWINIGGVLFLIADALIGVNRFILPFDYSTNVIVTIYMTAQLCIGWGLMLYRRKRTEGTESMVCK